MKMKYFGPTNKLMDLELDPERMTIETIDDVYMVLRKIEEFIDSKPVMSNGDVEKMEFLKKFLSQDLPLHKKECNQTFFLFPTGMHARLAFNQAVEKFSDVAIMICAMGCSGICGDEHNHLEHKQIIVDTPSSEVQLFLLGRQGKITKVENY